MPPAKRSWLSFVTSIVFVAAMITVGAGTDARPAVAQDGPAVRTLDVPGVLHGARLSDDGARLIVWENAQIHQGEILPDYLPLRLLDLDSGAETLLTGHTDYATDAVFSPDGAQIISYHINGEIIVWDAASGALLLRRTAFPGERMLRVLPDGSVVLMLGSFYTQFGVWNLETGAITQLLQQHFDTFDEFNELAGIGPPDRALVFDLLPDGSALIATTLYNRIERWDLTTGERTVLIETEDEQPYLDLRHIWVTANGASAVTWHTREQTAIRIDAQTGAEQARRALVDAAGYPGVSADGTRLYWVTAEPLRLNWAALDSDAAPDTLDLPPVDLPLRPIGAQDSIQFSHDGTRLVISGFFARDTAENVVLVVDGLPPVN